MSIINLFRNLNLGFNELIEPLLILVIALVVITGIVLIIKKIVHALKTEGEIDGRLRQTRARIARSITEIEDCKNRLDKVEVVISTEFAVGTLTHAKTKDTKPLMNHVLQNTFEEMPCIQEVSKVVPKGKKTRAMAMEDRWAEYDKKRSMKNTA